MCKLLKNYIQFICIANQVKHVLISNKHSFRSTNSTGLSLTPESAASQCAVFSHFCKQIINFSIPSGPPAIMAIFNKIQIVLGFLSLLHAAYSAAQRKCSWNDRRKLQIVTIFPVPFQTVLTFGSRNRNSPSCRSM